MNYNTFNVIKRIAKYFVILSIFSIILIIITKIFDNRIINNINNFLKNDIKVLYISDKKNYFNDAIELFKKYDIEYMYIDNSKYSNIEISNLKKLVNEKEINNVIILYNNGKKIDSLINCNSKKSLIEFFQNYNIIPEIIGKNDNIIDSVKEYIRNDYMILYIPYKYGEYIEEQDSTLREISEKYSIQYKLVNAYLLSDSQKQKLNNILQISNVETQIVVLIKNNEIYSSIRNVYDKEEYIKEFHKSNFVKEYSNRINNVDYNTFEEIISYPEKNVVFIKKDECNYCDKVNELLNIISNDYNIQINAINIINIESDISKLVQAELIKIGYDNGFSVPIVLIVESNKVLDYIIGSSDEKYYKELFLEYGIIKR